MRTGHAMSSTEAKEFILCQKLGSITKSKGEYKLTRLAAAKSAETQQSPGVIRAY